MVDRVTVEVVRNAAIYAAEEMGAVLRNTAFSPNIRDRLDYSCAILSHRGELVAQAEHIPVHLGSMSLGVLNMLRVLRDEGVELGPGDVAVANDPYITGTHLNDVTMVKPVFVEGRLVAYVANKAHHVDVGGVTPGSIGGGARSLLEEGMVIPPVKLVEGGRLRSDLLRFMASNVRTPEYFKADVMAQLASLNAGEKRIRELAERYSPSILLEVWDEVLDYTERYTRAKIRELPQDVRGSYVAEDYVETSSGELVAIRVKLTIMHDSILVDFNGTGGQVEEPLNAVYGVTVASTTYAVKSVIDPSMPMNQGFYRAVKVVAPRGTIVNPLPPAPVGGGNLETAQRIVDTVLRAFAEALPERVPAASCGTMSNLLLGGRGWAFYETIGCGSGARPCCDGVDGVQTNMTNTLNTPIEVAENEYPLLFQVYELRADSGGPGRWRGGLGIVRAVTVLEDNVKATVYADRSLVRPWGMKGGGSGEGFRAYVVRRDGSVLSLPAKTTVVLGKGDTLYIETPGGGGYGDPCERSRELIVRDIEEERITSSMLHKYSCSGGGEGALSPPR